MLCWFSDSTIKSCSNQFLPDFQESLSQSLVEKLNNFSFADERILRSVKLEKDSKGSLGMQITEGSDGKVYVQTVIPGGVAFTTGVINSGDQIISVNGQSLLSLKYEDALQLLKATGQHVEFVLSQITSCNVSIQNKHQHEKTLRSKLNLSDINQSHLDSISLNQTLTKLNQYSFSMNNTMDEIMDSDNNPIEKHITESCHDISNVEKYSSLVTKYKLPIDVPYHKHIRYEIEAENEHFMSKKNLVEKETAASGSSLHRSISKSCNQIYLQNQEDHNKAVVVEMIPKSNISLNNYHSLDRRPNKITIEDCNITNANSKTCWTAPQIALPRSLGLSRKWRGPVRYPVTPVKKSEFSEDNEACTTTSDEEQVFI